MHFPCNIPTQAVSEEFSCTIPTIETSIKSLKIGFRCGIQGSSFKELETDEKTADWEP